MSGTERRLAAIMAADVVGFSRQMGADEARTLARIAALRAEVLEPLLAEHRGRLFKTMGDGFLAEFASAVQAVACAVAVQARLAEQDDGLRLRIGVHSGDVVVQRDDLMGDGVNIAARLEPLAEPGGIVISARVREDLAGKLTVAAEDMGEQTLKNIVTPIRAWRIHPAAAPAAGPALPDKPSIAVLAFTNMSGDPDQEYFADGIAEDIITALSHIRWLFVIARNSSFIYRGRAVDLKQVGRELGVRYVLEGSVRRAGNRLRITAQLIEVDNGAHVWAERYDRAMDDMFDVQDEITTAVVGAMEPTLAAAERQRAARRSTTQLGVWELYHRGLWHVYKFAPAENQTGINYLLRAAEQDATSAAPHSALALAYYLQGWLHAPLERAQWRGPSLQHARIATRLDPLDATAHAILGLCLNVTGDSGPAAQETAQAVSLNPNNATLQGLHAAVLVWHGQPKEGLAHLDQAIRLSPLDPFRWYWAHVAATAHYLLGDYAASVAAGQEFCRLRPDMVFGHRVLVASFAELGRLDEAHHHADMIMDNFQADVTAFLARRWPEWEPGNYTRYVASLAKGGLVLRDGVLMRVE